MALIETFQHRNKTWTRYPAKASSRFVVGVDLGQSSDPTAVSVIHHHKAPIDNWDIREGRHSGTARQKVDERYDVRHLERLPLGTPYPAIVEHVGQLMARPPLRDGCDLVLDASGVGRPVADLFNGAGFRPIAITITAGAEATEPEPRQWHVAKSLLISTLDARLHTGELRFAEELTDAHALAEELKDFRRKVSTAGRYSYEARVGKHDDLVLSVAIGVWWAARPDQYTMTRGHELKGFYGG